MLCNALLSFGIFQSLSVILRLHLLTCRVVIKGIRGQDNNRNDSNPCKTQSFLTLIYLLGITFSASGYFKIFIQAATPE